MKEKLPNFLIIGVPKAGTTSVYFWLKQHPEVFMSPIKEPHYFSQIGNKDHITKWEDYLKLFEAAKHEKVRGEASTSYFHFYKTSIPLIKEKLGEHVKLLLILRNPIERAWSHWLMYCKYGILHCNDNIFKLDLAKHPASWKIKNPIIALGFYSSALEVWYNQFKDNLKVLLFEDMKKDPLNFIQEIYAFLNIDNSFIPKLEIRNISGKPRNKLIGKLLSIEIIQKLIPYIPSSIKNPLRNLLLQREEIPKDIRAKLKEIYYKDIIKTSKIINKDLSFWLEL